MKLEIANIYNIEFITLEIPTKFEVVKSKNIETFAENRGYNYIEFQEENTIRLQQCEIPPTDEDEQEDLKQFLKELVDYVL